MQLTLHTIMQSVAYVFMLYIEGTYTISRKETHMKLLLLSVVLSLAGMGYAVADNSQLSQEDASKIFSKPGQTAQQLEVIKSDELKSTTGGPKICFYYANNIICVNIP